MVLIGVVVDELYAIMTNVPIWGLWTRPGNVGVSEMEMRLGIDPGN